MDNDRDPAQPLMDSSGISLERKRRDDEAAYFNELYLLAPVGYFVVGFDSRILQANLVGAEMLGIARADPGTHRFRAFIGNGCAADFDKFMGRALNSQTPEKCRVQMRRAADGAEFPATLLALCEAIIAMTHKLGLKVVAEGVESNRQRARLEDVGCDYAQGYAIARPMEAAARWRRWRARGRYIRRE